MRVEQHQLFRIISNPATQQQVTLCLEFISKIPFLAGASDVKMSKLREHSSNPRM